MIPIEGGAPGAGKLALVKGYLSLSASESRDNAIWAERLRAAGWKGAIYQLRWESGATRDLLHSVGLSLLMRMGLKLAARRVLLPLPPLGVYELNEIRRHWVAARTRAESVDGHSLADCLRAESPVGEWTLLGHSLGARIVFNLLARDVAEDDAFRDAVMLGATVSRHDETWRAVTKSVSNRIVNVYHGGDRVLNWLFRATELNRTSPCGVKPVTVDHAQIRNVDASPWMKRSFRSHMQYHEVLHETVGPALWRPNEVIQLPYRPAGSVTEGDST